MGIPAEVVRASSSLYLYLTLIHFDSNKQPTDNDIKKTGRSLRLRLQRRNLHISNPPPAPIQTHRLRPR